MNKSQVIQKAIITQFINSKDKNIKFETVQDLIKEGNVREFYFKYKRKEDSDKSYIAQRIFKLDLYRKLITTIDNKVYMIMNKYGEIKAK